MNDIRINCPVWQGPGIYTIRLIPGTGDPVDRAMHPVSAEEYAKGLDILTGDLAAIVLELVPPIRVEGHYAAPPRERRWA